MKEKPVKCKYCGELVGHRIHNEFITPSGLHQKHKRSFAFACPACGEWQMFAVNENDKTVKLCIERALILV